MQTRPNILLIITDQHRADHLGCYGNRTVRTPNIDGLAARGTLFERFYVASGICMPNRATLMTGRMPSLHGVRHNGIPLSLQATVFPELLRAAGYRTALIGKSHLQNMLGTPAMIKAAAPAAGEAAPLFAEADHVRRTGTAYDQEREDRWADPGHDIALPFYGFDHVELCDEHGDRCFGHYSRWLKARAPEADRLRGRNNAIPTPEITVPQAWRTRLPVELYPTSYITERTEAFIAAQDPDEAAPFFLVSSFPDPHHPFTPPGRYWDMYDPAAIAAPATCRAPDENAPPTVKWLHAERAAGKANIDTPRVIAVNEREAREAIALTYGMISLIDDGVGRILDALARRGMAERTLVIFTSDHGDFMGDHGLLFKNPLHYQGLIRTPFLWVEPGERRGARCSALSGTLDIARSILSRTGIAPYNGIQGRDLAPLLRGEAASERRSMLIEEESQRIFGGFDGPVRCRTLVTERWRLTLYAGAAWGELYDLHEDPGETRNLWSDAARGGVKAELLEELARMLVESCDRSPLPTGLA